MLQGGISQILTIHKEACTGALSLKMNIIFYLKIYLMYYLDWLLA